MSHAYTELGAVVEWNKEEVRSKRIAALKELLPEPTKEVSFLMSGFMEIWPDLDVKLVGRDLGWFPESALLIEVFNDEEVRKGIKKIKPSADASPHYYITCRVISPQGSWQDRVNSGLREGDFVISINAKNGALKNFKFKRTPPTVEKREGGELTFLMMRTIPGRDSVDLLSSAQAGAVADIVDSILQQLQVLGPLPSPKRSLQ